MSLFQEHVSVSDRKNVYSSFRSLLLPGNYEAEIHPNYRRSGDNEFTHFPLELID